MALPPLLPELLLFDGPESGAGRVADWEAAARLAERTHLLLAGLLDKVAGIVMGKFTKIPEEGNSFNLEEIIEQLLVPLGIPVIRGPMIGHVHDKTTVPLGALAELDADAGTLTLLEPSVL